MEDSNEKSGQKPKRKLDIAVDKDVVLRIKYSARRTRTSVESVISTLVLAHLPEIPENPHPDQECLADWMAKHGDKLRELFLTNGWSVADYEKLLERMEESEMLSFFLNSSEERVKAWRRKQQEYQ